MSSQKESGIIEEVKYERKIGMEYEKMYTSDMSDSQWEIVKEILKEEKYRYVTEKREQVNAVFYLVKTGCQWRNW